MAGPATDRLYRLGTKTVKYLILVTVLCLTFGPMVWIWLNSLRTSRDIMRYPLRLPNASGMGQFR